MSDELDHNIGHGPTTVIYPEDDWTALVRRVPGYTRFREWRIRSWAVLLSAAGAGALTLALNSYFDGREARFARERTIVIGTLLHTVALDGDRQFCFVHYRFRPAGGDASHTVWRFWFGTCGRPGAPFVVEYVASSPRMNRPFNSGGKGGLLLTPMWGLSALLLIWGVLQRRAEGRVVGRDGFEAPAIVEKILEAPPGSFMLTYRYEAGVKGTQYGQCEVSPETARQLTPGMACRVRVDPIHPARSDWLGPADPTQRQSG